ncbi:MAG: hypothetical protein DWQ44_00385 [Bacteroidetes bacterium]|mgnify:CR=1 FL=1|nr:MAG: hypothetical protein DWQ33_03760 [Bacteroidota bacterium]REK07596.1 MAG: hypothetical protein DWQ39_01510 [Bacteroidota bacterium]REK36972.1 MAG: hypothetical protein DWQ44_00385 [Bacteroidota bacterium]REK47792.1 MAG: hypothetical protein DWQ48_11445 [Bacteroidota bacterium]
MTKNCGILILLILVSVQYATHASDTLQVNVSGRAFDSEDPGKRLDDLMIINLRTGQGIFGKADGTFSISIRKNDTIMIASTGYEYKRISVTDSVYKSHYELKVPLLNLKINLREVVIFSPRDLENIYKDIEKLGYNRRELQIGGVDAISSPITFLYQEFSRLEKLKRHNAERINNDKRRQLLKDLMVNYVASDIFYLDSSEFDDFIDYCDVPEAFMKQASQYDFCVFIKRKFELYNLTKGKKY